MRKIETEKLVLTGEDDPRNAQGYDATVIPDVGDVIISSRNVTMEEAIKYVRGYLDALPEKAESYGIDGPADLEIRLCAFVRAVCGLKFPTIDVIEYVSTKRKDANASKLQDAFNSGQFDSQAE